MPLSNAGRRVPSRNSSQLSLESWTATIVQPPADGPAAWEDLTLGQNVACRMHRGKHRLVLLLGTAWKVMHDCVGHNVLWPTERAGANSCAPGQSTLHRGGDPGNT